MSKQTWMPVHHTEVCHRESATFLILGMCGEERAFWYSFVFLSDLSLIIALPWKSLCQFPCWILFKLLDLSKLLHGFIEVVKFICQNWYMDFSELLCGFVKVPTWICQSSYMDLLSYYTDLSIFSRTLPNKTKLKLDQDFKASRSFYFEIKLLNESKSSMPWVHCAFYLSEYATLWVCVVWEGALWKGSALTA